jgi:hypothetical protein
VRVLYKCIIVMIGHLSIKEADEQGVGRDDEGEEGTRITIP